MVYGCGGGGGGKVEENFARIGSEHNDPENDRTKTCFKHRIRRDFLDAGKCLMGYEPRFA